MIVRGLASIFVPSLFLGAGAFVLAKGVAIQRKARWIADAPVSTTPEASEGWAGIVGRAEAPSTLVSPLTQTKCVAFRYAVTEKLIQPALANRTVASGDSFHVPFALKCKTGPVHVNPIGAEFRFGKKYRFRITGGIRRLPENLKRFMDDNNLEYRAPIGMRDIVFEEWTVRPGQVVLVVGTVENGGANGQGATIGRTLQRPLIVSDRDLRDLVRDYARDSYVWLAAGVLLVLGSVALAFLPLVLWRMSSF